MTKPPELVPSLVRTALPYALSATTVLAARLGLDLPQELLAEWVLIALTFLFGTAYYALSRLVERYLSPLWGALMLGSGRTPTYTPTTEPEPVAGSCSSGKDCVDRNDD